MKYLFLCLLFLSEINSLIFAEESINPARDLYQRTYHISKKGDYLFASSTAGLTVYKYTKGKVEIVSSLVVENSGSYSIIDGEYLYLFAGNSGIYKIDISDPRKLKILSDARVDGSALNGEIEDDSVFVALGSTGFARFSKKDLKLQTHLETPSYCSYVKIVKNKKLLVFTEKDGVLIYEITSKGLNPIGKIELKYRVRDGVVYGEYLYLANDTEGVTVLKISKGGFVNLGTFDTPDTARGVALYKNFLFVADGNTGVVVFDILKDGTLKYWKNKKTEYSTNKIMVTDETIYISHDAMGILVMNALELLK